MKASRIIVVTVAMLLLAAVSMWGAAWSVPDAQAEVGGNTLIWSTADVLVEIQPGLNSEELRQIADNKLDRIRKNLSGEDANSRQNEEINYSYSQAYRIYSISEMDIIKGYEEKGSLGECVSSEYRWHIPLVSGKTTKGTATLAESEDGSWGVVSYGDAHEEEYSLLGNLDLIEELLASEGLEKITEIKAAYLPLYHTTMLYVCADGEEYAMVAREARFTDLQVHKLYRAKDFVGAFEQAFGRVVPQDPNEPIGYGISGSK